MKLLLDQNLSYKLCSKLNNLFPEITHIKDLVLETASDEEVWLYARANSCVIVSKDSDYVEKAILRKYPPKVIWIKAGNCSTDKIELLLRNNHKLIKDFITDKENSILTIF